MESNPNPTIEFDNHQAQKRNQTNSPPNLSVNDNLATSGLANVLKRTANGVVSVPYSQRKHENPRLYWTPELKKAFHTAVTALGETATAKLVMDHMTSQGVSSEILTRKKIQSFMQKHKVTRKNRKASPTPPTPTKETVAPKPPDTVRILFSSPPIASPLTTSHTNTNPGEKMTNLPQLLASSSSSSSRSSKTFSVVEEETHDPFERSANPKDLF